MTRARVTIEFTLEIDPELYPLSHPNQSLFEAFTQENFGDPLTLVEEAIVYKAPVTITFKELS
jgi:hypothetical protein